MSKGSKAQSKRVNPFLAQRQFGQLIHSLSKEKKKVLALAICQVCNDCKAMPIDTFKRVYLREDNDEE